MTSNQEWDECIEKLWYMKEKNQSSLRDLEDSMGEDFKANAIEGLTGEGMLLLTQSGSHVQLTDDGEKYARRLIRSHRLAERLVYDVLGGEFEAGACEFEHIANAGLVDSICTLLGHPHECPHGMPIPSGSCCRNSLNSAESSVMRLTEMKVGQAARIAYINCRDDKRLHKLEGLQVRPGMTVTLHQKSPTTVIECEGSNIAIDEAVCADICLWKDKMSHDISETSGPHAEQPASPKKGGLFRLNFFRR